MSSRLVRERSLEDIIFLLRMARGTSGLGIRSGFTIGCRVTGGAGWAPAMEFPWNAITFIRARVYNESKKTWFLQFAF